jgi:hypothetical protein
MENLSGLSSIATLLEECYRGKPRRCNGWFKYAEKVLFSNYRGIEKYKPKGFDIVQNIVCDLFTNEEKRKLIDPTNIDEVMKKLILGAVLNVCKKKCILIPISSLKHYESSESEEDNIGADNSDSKLADPKSFVFYRVIESTDSINNINRILLKNNMNEEHALFNERLKGKTLKEAGDMVKNPNAVNRRLVRFLKQYILKHPL